MKNILFRILRLFWNKTHTKTYRIIKNPDDVFTILHHIQDETWVKMYIPEIYDSSKERIVEGKYPSENFYLIPNAIVSVGSDLVLTSNGVWWDKYYDDDFYATAQPYDSNIQSFTSETVSVSRRLHKIYLKGETLSLIGVFSDAWSHFLFQFITKLYFAKDVGLLGCPINLLVDKTSDNNIIQMVDDVIRDFPNVNKIYACRNTDYKCEKLICMRSTSSNYNEMRYWLDYRQLTPKSTIDSIEKNLVLPLVNRIKNNHVNHKKLFLPRKNNRFLTNNEEIERYFKEQGFYFVEGKEYSLEQKADLFYHADIIVGLHGAAWLNTIFCNRAKCLMLGNSRNIQETLFYTLAYNKVKRWINVTGLDVNAERRSNYFIPLDKVKAAYTELLHFDS